MSYRYEIDKYYGKAYSPPPKSLEQILRHPVKGVEDEDLEQCGRDLRVLLPPLTRC